MGAGNFPVDLILLGMIAAFLVLRLRSVLGKRTGFERAATLARPAAPAPRTIDVKAEPTPDRATPASRTLPDRASPAGQGLARIEASDASFNPARFLDGAEAAFRLIVLAFARGDRAALRPLLTPAMMDSFEAAITERETNHLTQHTTLHSIHNATLHSASVDGTLASITVLFTSDQISYTTNASNTVTHGTDALTELTDLWTLERDLTTRDPAWRLAGAQSG